MTDLRIDYLRRLETLQLWKRDQAALRAQRYLDDPVAWAADCIEWPRDGGLSAYQNESLEKLVEKGRVAKRGPHGLGKTTDMSVAALWFSTTRDMAGIDWKVITTASVWRQLAVYLWPEIHKWAARLRWDVIGREPFNTRTELLALQLKLKHGAATAVASNQPERIEGAHADEILYILDEAKIIAPPTWDAIEGALSNAGSDTQYKAFVLAMSTPGAPSGRFFDIHRHAAGYEDWHTRHVTLEEAIAAGRISREWAEQRKRQWGEHSALYQGRVLGNFHADEEDSVIPLSWVDAAIERWHEWAAQGKPDPKGNQWVGVDVGRGGDSSVLAIRSGHVVNLKVLEVRDTMKVVEEVRKYQGRAIVDVIGVGAGVFDRLKELKANPVAYTGSEKSPLRDRSKAFSFPNTRSAAYWHMRELLDPEFEPTLCLPPDDLLISDLTTPKWETLPTVPPRIKVENKDDVVARLGRSPDRGDACLAAGTMIMAEAGEVPIEDIRPGMKVWTRAGLRRVVAAGRTGQGVPLTSVILTDGRGLTGTGNHPVWDGMAFRPLDTFSMSVNMWTWQKSTSSTVGSLSLGTLKVHGDIPASTTGQIEPGQRKALKPFTLKSTRRRLVPSLTAGTCTTRMVTRWTTALKTWRRSLPSTTRTGIFRWRGSTSGTQTPSTCVSSENSPRLGTHHPRGESGTPSTVNGHGKDANANQAEPALGAVSKSKPSSRPKRGVAGVPDSATFDGMTRTTSTASTETVKSVESLSEPSDHEFSLAPVPVAQKCDGGIGDVWNLEVEGMPEYFANGILVHNCVMSLYADAIRKPTTFTLPDGHLPTTSLSPLA